MNLLAINKRLNRRVPATSPHPDRVIGLLTGKPTSKFLPPNVTQPKGEGSVLFTLQPQLGMVSSTTFPNSAVVLHPIPTAKSLTSDFYAGVSGQTCGFHSVAHDAMGYNTDAPATPDAFIMANRSAQNIGGLATKQFFCVHVQ